jgi:hypothetical protein
MLPGYPFSLLSFFRWDVYARRKKRDSLCLNPLVMFSIVSLLCGLFGLPLLLTNIGVGVGVLFSLQVFGVMCG